MASSITVDKRVTANADNTYRLQVWVSETSENIPSEIFVHRNAPVIDDWDGPTAVYYGICNYADIINYPASVVDTSSNFFRKSGADLEFKSAQSLNTTWEQILEDVQQLVDDIVRTYNAVGSDVSYTGINFDVVATLKHYADAAYSYLLTMVATEAIFVVEKQTDGEPELVGVASIADMNAYSTTVASTSYYRTASATLAINGSTTYSSTKTALDADFAALDAALTDPGISVTGTDDETLDNAEGGAGTNTYYFGD